MEQKTEGLSKRMLFLIIFIYLQISCMQQLTRVFPVEKKAKFLNLD